MTIHGSRIQVGVQVAAESQPVELVDESFRVLIVGDFGGGPRSSSMPFADRAIRIDRDGIDAAMAIVAPALRVAIDPSSDADLLAFHGLDELHPDQLLESVSLLKQLRSLHAEVLRPGSGTSPTSRVNAASATAPAAGGSLLDMILDNEQPVAISDDDLSDVIRRAVRPHLAPETSEAQTGMLSQIDDAIVAALRVVLHHSAFQAMEAAWRGTDFFIRRCNAGAESQIAIADVSAADLRVALIAASSNALRDLFTTTDGSPRWSLVLCIHSFGPSDVDMLDHLAELAAACRTPWLVGAKPELVGTSSLVNGADMDDWDTSPPSGWDALRQGPNARYLGVVMPRVLLRSPYGADTDPIDTMAFEEFSAQAVPHDSYLWGGGALVAGLIGAEEVERGAPRQSHGTVGGLPFHVARVDGIAVAKPCAEALMSQRTIMHLLDLGLTPLVSQKDGDVVRVPRLQSIASPPAPLAFGEAGER